MTRSSLIRGVCVLALASGLGCLGPAPLRTPPPASQPTPVPVPAPPPANTLESRLIGTWENTEKPGKPKTLTFEPGGRLTFTGGLELYNPGQWALDEGRQELMLTLPEADVDRLRVFQMNLGDAVKAFDPARKRITYRFDEQTWALNIGGWMYSKAEVPVIKAAPQPPLD